MYRTICVYQSLFILGQLSDIVHSVLKLETPSEEKHCPKLSMGIDTNQIQLQITHHFGKQKYVSGLN